MGLAAGVIVGQSLGAEQPDRAKKTIYWALGYVMIVKGILSILIFTFPWVILAVFNREPDFLELASIWIRIQALGFLAMGVAQVFQNSFQTAGDTTTPMLITLVSLWIIEIPLAYVLSQYTGLGQFGIAWAIFLAMIIRAVAYIPVFFWGRWLRIKMFDEQPVAAEPTARE